MADWPTLPAGAGYPFVDADTGEFISTAVNAALYATYEPHSGVVVDVVEQFGAEIDGTTDDTDAWQDAINYVAGLGGGRIVSSRNGVSIIAGPLQNVSGANAQLVLPNVDYVSAGAKCITIAIEGSIAPPPVMSVIGSTGLSDEHLVLKSTLTSGSGGAMIRGKYPASSFDNFTNILLRLRNVAFRMPANPTHSAIDLNYVAACDIDNVIIDAGTYAVIDVTEPTTATSYGLRLPGNNNGAHVNIGTVHVIGFYNAYQLGEHTSAKSLSAWGSVNSAVLPYSNHPLSVQRFMIHQCVRGLSWPDGQAAITVGTYVAEHANPADSYWFTTDADIYDPANDGRGTVRYSVVRSGVGVMDSDFLVTGGSGLSVAPIRAGAGVGDSGIRSLTNIMPSATRTAHPDLYLYGRRVGNRVIYSTATYCAASAGGTVVLLDAADVPAGFTHPSTHPNAASSPIACQVFDNNTGGIISGCTAYFSDGGGLKIFGLPTGATFILFSLEFETIDAFPGSLPGVATS